MNLGVAGRILITGASGELGGALAERYAATGRPLLLWGRDRARLDRVAALCEAAGAAVVTRSLDLMDVSAAVTMLEAEDDDGAIGLAIFVAGLGDIAPPGEAVEDAAQVIQLGLVNFVAPAALSAAMARRMAQRGEGAIVTIGSAAAFHALPFAAAYAASKAGLARFSDALRLAMKEHGVRVTHVSPGFIDTAAARRTPGPTPFALKTADVAERIARAVEQGRGHVIMPWPFALLRWVDRLLPGRLRDRLLLSLRPPL